MGLAVFSLISARATELIANGGFESGLSSWTAFYGTGIQATLTTYPHTGSHYAYLTGNSSSGGIYQNVTIPANASSATLSFWWNVSSDETTSTTIYDDFYVILYDSSGINQLATVKILSNLNKGTAGAYQQVTYDLMAYRGQTIRLGMNGQNDGSNNTTFRIDDVSVSVTTTCSYSLSSYSASPDSSSGSSSFSVYAGSGCSWSAVSDATSWLHTSSSGSGNGTVNYSYDANPNTSSRIGHITAGGQSFTVTQDGAPCSYSLSSYSASPGYGSGSSSFNVIAGSGCSWSAVSDATTWLHTSSSGSGNGTVNYSYDANASTSSRIGHITAGGQSFTVTQDGVQNQLTGVNFSNGVFRFVLNGSVGSNYVIRASTNLINWVPILTNTIPPSGVITIVDPSATNYNRRLYRAVMP